MTRSGRVATTIAQELRAAELADSNRGTEFEESDDELNAVELTPEDLYEDTEPSNDGEEYKNIDKPKEVAERAIAKAGGVYVIYKGLRSGARPPVAVTLTVPEGNVRANDATALITKGETFVLKPGKPVEVSPREAKWLCSHPVYMIEKS